MVWCVAVRLVRGAAHSVDAFLRCMSPLRRKHRPPAFTSSLASVTIVVAKHSQVKTCSEIQKSYILLVLFLILIFISKDINKTDVEFLNS